MRAELGWMIVAGVSLWTGCEACSPPPEPGPVCGREIHVALHQPGMTPADLEAIVEPVERGLTRLDGVEQLRSRIEADHALIRITATRDTDARALSEAVTRSVDEHGLEPGTAVVRSALRSTRSISFVSEVTAEEIGHPTRVMTLRPEALEAAELDVHTLLEAVRAQSESGTSLADLRQMRVASQPLEALVDLRLAEGPRVETASGEARFVRLDEGTLVTLNDCDGAPPVEDLVRARIETQTDVAYAERRRMAEPLMDIARQAGQTPYLLLDIDLDAALIGRPATRAGATEVVVLGNAPELARAWRSHELAGAALSVDASDVRRLRVSVERAQSGAVLARLATSPDVAELLPSPRGRSRRVAEVITEAAARHGRSPEAIASLARASLEGIEVAPGLRLEAPPFDRITLAGEADGPRLPLTELIEVREVFDDPLSRADGRRVQHFEARILPETDREALLRQVLGR